MRLFILIMMLSSFAFAGNLCALGDNCPCDHFQMSNRDHQIHVVTGAVATIVISQVLIATGIVKKPAVPVVAGLTAFALFAFRETYLDDYNCTGDNTASLVGIGAGTVFNYAILTF